MEDCIFDKIVSGEVPADIVDEGERYIAFRDIDPIAPVHILIIPRERIVSMNDLEDRHRDVLADINLAAVKIAKAEGIAEDGYKFFIRTGQHGGQEVPYIHFHLVGGEQLNEKHW